jgi:hypothetical protein
MPVFHNSALAFLLTVVFRRVDTYGSSISRDIAPTVEGGSVYYDIMSSCLSVASLGLSNPGLLALNASLYGGSCAVGNELCCTYNTTTDAWQNVWALRLPGDTYDRLLTTDPNELNTLVAQGWDQVCNPFTGPTAFCVDQGLLHPRPAPTTRSHPFTAVCVPITCISSRFARTVRGRRRKACLGMCRLQGTQTRRDC